MVIGILDILKIINFTLAVLALVPSYRVLIHLIRSRAHLTGAVRYVNLILEGLVLFFIGTEIFNAILSLIALLSWTLFLNNLWVLGVRTLFVNTAILVIAVALDFFTRSLFRK